MGKRESTKDPPVGSSSALCIACRHVIPARAKLCADCGTFQNRWRSRLQFVATITGLASLIGAAVVYAVTTAPELRKTFAWRTNLRVIAFESNQGITVVNAGDGPVLLSHVALSVDRIGTSTMPINEVAQRAGVVRHRSPAPMASHWKSRELIEHPTSAEWQRAIRNASPVIGERNYCVAAIVFVESDPAYLMFVAAHRGHSLPSVGASATLHYWDLRTGAGSIPLSARALLFRSTTCPERDPSVH